MAACRWAALLFATALTLRTVARAFSGALDHRDFPDLLLVKVEALPILFPLHMATGALALLLVPAAIALAGERRHRLVARVAAADVAVAAVTAVPVALESPLNIATAAGFVTQAAVWFALLAFGVRAIRRRDVRTHRACMLLMAAVTSGAMFFRIFLALWVAFDGYAHFKLFYACDAFAAWSAPLASMALWLIATRRGTAGVHARAAVTTAPDARAG